MPTTRPGIISAFLCLLVLCSLATNGCASYKLQGNVIEGRESRILIVNADDPRLTQRGLGGVSITVTQDPQSLGRKQVGQGESNGEGRFAIPISSFGAGFLQYPVQILARRMERVPAIGDTQLPGLDQRLLVVMAGGRDAVSKPKSAAAQSEDLLNETLKETQSYRKEK